MTEFICGRKSREGKEVAKELNKIADEVLKMESESSLGNKLTQMAKELVEEGLTITEEGKLEQAHLAPHDRGEKFLIHRSAILTYKACPYKAYLEYWWRGHGVVPSEMPQHLLIGICIHRGLQHLLEHCRVDHPNGDFTEKCIDDAVMFAHQVYAEILGKKSLELKRTWKNGGWEEEDLNYTVREIGNLIEALIRAYAIARLRDFLDEYEVLEVETEEVFDSFSEIVTWLGKADALVRRRRDNALLPISFKTAAEFSNSTMFNILIDMQGCSEIVAIEERLNRIYSAFCEATSVDTNGVILYKAEFVNKGITKIANGDLIKLSDGLLDYFADARMNGIKIIEVFANQYEYLIKGKHRADSSEPTKYKYHTPLLHAIKSDAAQVMQLGSGLTFGDKLPSKYEWQIPTGKLPKGKRKIDIADDIGIKNWIEMLAKGEVQPELGNPFDDIIIAGEERIAARNREQLKEWRISTQFEAEEIAGRVKVLNDIQETIKASDYSPTSRMLHLESLQNLLQEKLFQWFRRDGKDSQLCYNYYGGKCPFTEHCHKGLAIEDGLESGMWEIREPHHELERKRFVEKGWLKEDASDK